MIERAMYLELLKKSLTGLIRPGEIDLEKRLEGRDVPIYAETMIGMKRLNNLQQCIIDILRLDIPGDLIETGVWRGGATIFMRGVLKTYNVTNRIVWVADSFEGIPKPNKEKYPADALEGDKLHSFDYLKVSIDEVKNNFSNYSLWDDQVKFLEGWFKDTLPKAPIEKLAILRLDGDLYESTMDALVNLYPKLSIGGYCIIDDYGVLRGCRQAVEDYRTEQKITEQIIKIDYDGVYWKKLK